MTNFSNS